VELTSGRVYCDEVRARLGFRTSTASAVKNCEHNASASRVGEFSAGIFGVLRVGSRKLSCWSCFWSYVCAGERCKERDS
jgi:hypothetical protein